MEGVAECSAAPVFVQPAIWDVLFKSHAGKTNILERFFFLHVGFGGKSKHLQHFCLSA